jgi:hypothetical protein
MPARLMARGPRSHVLVLLPDGMPESPTRDAVPCGSLVWIDSDSVACEWADWPARAAVVRGDMVAAVSSVVAAIGGRGAPVLAGVGGSAPADEGAFTRARSALNRWARPDPRDPFTVR